MKSQMFKLDLEVKGTRDQIANICWIIEKAREIHKKIYFCFLDYTKVFDGADHNKLKKIPEEIGIPDHLMCFLQNLYAGQVLAILTGVRWYLTMIFDLHFPDNYYLFMCLFIFSWPPVCILWENVSLGPSSIF